MLPGATLTRRASYLQYKDFGRWAAQGSSVDTRWQAQKGTLFVLLRLKGDPDMTRSRLATRRASVLRSQKRCSEVFAAFAIMQNSQTRLDPVLTVRFRLVLCYIGCAKI